MNKNKITIITVTFNAVNYIEKTILSIISQDYKNIEFIIIDGNSNDGTLNIIKKYEKFIDYWVSEKDRGIYDAMNKGIDKSTGKWINFMNAGDCFTSNTILSEIFTNSNYEKDDILFGDRNIVDNDGNIITVDYAFEDIEMLTNQMSFGHQSSFVRTELLKKYKFNLQYSLSADYDFFLKMLKYNYKFKYIDKIVSNFLDGGLSAQHTNRSNMEAICSLQSNFPNDTYAIDCQFLEGLTNDFIEKYSTIVDNMLAIYNRYNKVAVYGHSKTGKLMLKVLKDKAVVCIDSNIESKEKDYDIVHPSKLPQYTYDVIVICLIYRENTIKKILINDYSIDENKIIDLRNSI